MMDSVKLIENPNLILDEIKVPLQLDKALCLGWYNKALHAQGHFSDYLNGARSCLILHAHQDCQLVLWDSSALIAHCLYNDALSVNFQIRQGVVDETTMLNAKTWSSNQGFILRRTPQGCDLTYYFSLLHSHALTGELSISPCVYFMDNPDFILGFEAQASIRELLKIEPICLDMKADQLICFDKFHYQVEYNPYCSFCRV